MFFCASIPAALGSIYKEIVLKETEMDVYYMNFWVAVSCRDCAFLAELTV